MSPRLYRVLFWGGIVAAAIVVLALLQGVLVPFAAAFAIAYLLRPAVDRLEFYGVRRSLASLAVLTAFLLGLALVLVLIVPLVQGQIVHLLARFPGLVSAAQQQFGNFMQLLRAHLPAAEAAKVRDVVSNRIGDAVNWFASLFQSMTPKRVGDRIRLHPVWVIFALLAGARLFGLGGVFVSVPAAAVLGVLARFALERYRASTLYDPHRAASLCRREPDE